jgi:Skp family chaperone for outer membrane proteins
MFAQGTAPSGGEIPKMRIAIVDILSFREQVGELKVKYDKLQTEFSTFYTELESMQTKLAAQEKTLSENRSLTPQQAARLTADLEAGKKEYQRKLEDLQELARRREAEETEAIYDKLSSFLDDYCRQRGITSVFDARRLQETGIVVYASYAANITDHFIEAYNKLHPFPAAGAAKP